MRPPNRAGLESRASLLAGLGVGLLSLLAYVLTLSPTVNFIDSGEFIAVGAQAGIAHPPGYPLYTLLTVLGAALPFSDRAVGVNLISALSGALAVGLFCALVYEIVRHHLQSPRQTAPARPPTARRSGQTRGASKGAARQARAEAAVTPAALPDRPDWYAISASAGAALLLGASFAFWDWSTQAKMYSLHFAFVAGVFLLALRVRRAVRDAQEPGPLWPPRRWPSAAWWLVLLSLALGLALTNHPMSLLLLPPLAVLLLWPHHSSVQIDGRAGQVPRAAPFWRWLLF
jgi:Protein of unknown function (DUF2723)